MNGREIFFLLPFCGACFGPDFVVFLFSPNFFAASMRKRDVRCSVLSDVLKMTIQVDASEEDSEELFRR